MRSRIVAGLVGVLLSGAGVAHAQDATISLVPDASCSGIGDTLTVDVVLSDVTGVDEVIGGQFRLSYDTTVLTIDTVAAADSVWTELLFQEIDGANVTLLVNVPTDPPGPGALAGTMARLTFTVDAAVCDASNLITFRADNPPTRTRLSALLGGSALSIQSNSLTRNDLSAITLGDAAAPILAFDGPEHFDTDTTALWAVTEVSGFVCPDQLGTNPVTSTPTWDAAGSIAIAIPSVACDPQVGDTAFASLATDRVLDAGGAYDGALLGDLTGRVVTFKARLNTSLPDDALLSAADFFDFYGAGSVYNPGLSINFADGVGSAYYYVGSAPGTDGYLDFTTMHDNEWAALLIDLSDASKWHDAAGQPADPVAFAAAVADVDVLRISGTGGDDATGLVALSGTASGLLEFDFVVAEDNLIRVSTDPGLCTADVDLPSITASDDCTDPVIVAYSVAGQPISSPHTFDAGPTVVDVAATDDCGNIASWRFEVFVDENEAPTISDATATDGDVDASCSATVTFGATFADACCLAADDIVVDVQRIAGDATLGTPVIDKTGNGPIDLDGSVAVTDLASCSATVQIALFATDCYQNAAGAAPVPATDGRWTESYGAGGPPDGSGLSAASWDGATLGGEWSLSGLTRVGQPVLLEDTHTNDPDGGGQMVWQTTYAGGTIWLAAALWGGDVTADIVSHVHITHHVYVNGQVDLLQTWTDAVTHAIVPGAQRAVTFTGVGKWEGDGAAPPADYPAMAPGYETVAQWGRLEDLRMTEATVLTADVADLEPPAVTDCPTAIDVPADAGGCAADVAWTAVGVSDNCDADPTVAYDIDLDSDASIDFTVSDPSYTFPTGTHTVLVRATDACGNVNDTCTFGVTVGDVNVVALDLALNGDLTGTTLTRCLTVALASCSGPADTVTQEVTFTDGVAMGVGLTVACGAYDCISVHDDLHALRKRLDAGTDFDIVDGVFVANFTGANALIQGDLYDDLGEEDRDIIDILDFGVYISAWGDTYGTVDCGTGFPHADLNGDGIVDVSDFSFITLNILVLGDPACCVADGPVDPAARLSVPVAELVARGLTELVIADLNDDDVVDLDDVAAFLDGARPGSEGIHIGIHGETQSGALLQDGRGVRKTPTRRSPWGTRR
jgi:hypothetical protein